MPLHRSHSKVAGLGSALGSALACTLALATFATSGLAQEGGRGFLFGEPRTSATLRIGWAGASAGSDLFAFTTEQLTINRGDFSSLGMEGEVAWRASGGTFLVATLGISGMEKRSEFRDYYDNNQLPIEQNTDFTRVPLTVGLKQYLLPTGRSIGKFAWVPARVAPYIGIGAGVMYYQFHQSGDFINFATMDVFTSQYESSGWVPTWNVRGGADFSLTPRFALTADARYQMSKAGLSRDFFGFEKLDLSGFSTTVGLTIRY